jgi:hypothetical protein
MKRLCIILFWILVTAELHGQTKSSINLGNGVILSAVVESFKADQHKYDTCDTGQVWKTICLIDGEIWFGTDQGLSIPKNQLTKMTIKINGIEIGLDVSGMYNPTFTGQLAKKQFKLKSIGEEYILYGYFSDGAGTYTAHWTIIRGKSLRQIITKDERDFYWQLEK